MIRKHLIVSLICIICTLVLPIYAIDFDKSKPQNTREIVATHTLPYKQTDESTQTVKIYMSETKKVQKITLKEYLVGVVLCEMDGTFPNEALKAQIIASHTMLEWRKRENKDKNYDITDDYTLDQGYFTHEQRKNKYGAECNSLENRAGKLVDAVHDKLIYCDGEIICAVYHAISGGKTENAKDIWGGQYKYLQSVDSASDIFEKNYLTSVSVSKNEFFKKLNLKRKDKISITNIKKTGSKSVKTININGKKFTGEKIRSIFSLRSMNFDITVEKNNVIFTVRGYGHGVGMSQRGAAALANKGKGFEQILLYYYKNCEIKP